MRRLELTEIARDDLKSIRRYSQRTWGPERTLQYLAGLRDTMKGLVAGTVLSRERNDLKPGLRMTASGRHCVFLISSIACEVERAPHTGTESDGPALCCVNELGTASSRRQ